MKHFPISIKFRHIVLCGVLCLFYIVLHGQVRPRQLRNEILKSQAPPKTTQKSKKLKGSGIARPFTPFKPLTPIISPLNLRGVTLIYMENADSMTFDKMINPDYQILHGHVRFKHDNATLYCDSAYFYTKANSLDAFGHVKIVQADTLFAYSDLLFYDGNLKLARMRRNVKLENRKTTLLTDSLNYDRIANLAYYYTGGRITDQLNTLTSIWGQYSPANNETLFRKDVHLTNKNYTLNADSLRYNTRTHIANLIGPTHIRYNDETDIYSTRGWYNTGTEQSMLLDRSQIKHKDGKTLTGDTLFYDKRLRYGEGFSHVIMNDSVQKSTLYGNYNHYNDNTKMGLVADSALLVDWSGKDTMFVHADTLFSQKDSIYNMARGYYNVRFFRTDVQGVCDSLTYSERDSVLNMHGSPLVWADENQLSGNNIKIFTKKNKVSKIEVREAAMAIQHQDSVYYNQLSGKEITAYVDSNQLRKVSVNGNAETVYYPMDSKDSLITGLNKTESSFVVMYLKNKKVDKVVMTKETTGTMYPLISVTSNELYLKNFNWFENQRPKNKQDLFLLLDSRKKSKRLIK